MEQARVKDLIEYLQTLPELAFVDACNPALCQPLDKGDIKHALYFENGILSIVGAC